MRRIAPCQRGMSLIELMIALVIGLIVVGTAMAVFISNSGSTRFSVSMADLQSRARIALDELAVDIRSAGYLGCASASGLEPAVPVRKASAASIASDWVPVTGFSVAAGSWLPANPPGYTPPSSGFGEPVAGSDAILLEGGALQGVPLAKPTNDRSSVVVSGPYPGLEPGALALISDCARAEAFHVDSAAAELDGTYGLGALVPINGFYAPDPAFPIAARVLPYRRALFYVGETGRRTERGDPVRALFEHLHPYSDTTPTEIASGVDVMVVRYRQRSAAGTVSELAATDAGFAPEQIIGIRLALLISTDEYVEGRTAPDEFTLIDIDVPAGVKPSAASFPDDERIRRVFERTETIRSRDARQGT